MKDIFTVQIWLRNRGTEVNSNGFLRRQMQTKDCQVAFTHGSNECVKDTINF